MADSFELHGPRNTKPEKPQLDAEEMRDLLMIEPFIMGDTRDLLRGPYETVYVFCETEDNAYSPLMKAVELANSGYTKSISICDGPVNPGYSGFEKFVEHLYGYGLRKDFTEANGNIRKIRIPIAKDMHTLGEARALVNDITNREGDTGVIAPPFHLVRAFMTAITALTKSVPEAAASKNIFAIKGIDQPPFQEALHSQGIVSGTRFDLEQGEIDRLKKYQRSDFGGLIAPKDVIAYLKERDQRVGLS